jgi:hypothetical protein
VLAAGVLRDSHPEGAMPSSGFQRREFLLPRFSPHTTCLQAVPLLPKPVTRPNCSASAGIRGHPSGFRVAIQCFARCGPESRARPRTQTDYERLLNGPSGFHSSALLSRATAALEPPRPALACVLLCRFLQQVPQKPGNLNARAPRRADSDPVDEPKNQRSNRSIRRRVASPEHRGVFAEVGLHPS